MRLMMKRLGGDRFYIFFSCRCVRRIYNFSPMLNGNRTFTFAERSVERGSAAPAVNCNSP
jgi:hypothetical protein